MIASEYVALKPDNSIIDIKVIIHSPIQQKTGEYGCKIDILGLKYSDNVYGEDALQAYCLVIKRLKLWFAELVADGWKFYFPSDTENEFDISSVYFNI